MAMQTSMGVSKILILGTLVRSWLRTVNYLIYWVKFRGITKPVMGQKTLKELCSSPMDSTISLSRSPRKKEIVSTSQSPTISKNGRAFPRRKLLKFSSNHLINHCYYLSLVKGMEKNGESSESDSDVSDAIASQVRRLAMEVGQLASARQITVLNGNFGQIGNMTSLIVPAAAMGALCYGCMWWKCNVANAVSSLTKHLESVSEALARHLGQRIEKLDGKLDEQVEISKLIKNEVTDVRGDLSQIGFDLDALQRMASGLDGKICSLEDKQIYLGLEIIKYLKTTRTMLMDLANLGVLYLCNFVDGRKVKMPEVLQEQLKLSGKPRGYLNSSEPPSLMGLKEIADSLVSENANRFITDGTMQEGIERLDDRPRTLMSFEVLSSLHPTPAVCGFPIEEARVLIAKTVFLVDANDVELEERIIQELAAGAAMGLGCWCVLSRAHHHIARRDGPRSRSSVHGHPQFVVEYGKFHSTLAIGLNRKRDPKQLMEKGEERDQSGQLFSDKGMLAKGVKEGRWSQKFVSRSQKQLILLGISFGNKEMFRAALEDRLAKFASSERKLCL
ncbi:unnamed protein product [Camellia sinensis]